LAGDVRDSTAVSAAVAAVDAVCHLAALTRARESLTRPAEYWRVNAIGTINVLDAIVRSKSCDKLVVASTGAIYGQPAIQPVDELCPPAPQSPYAASKLAADEAIESYARAGFLCATSVRSYNIAGGWGAYSDGDVSRLIPKIMAVQQGKEQFLTVNGDGSVIRDYVHVLDMAQALVLALTNLAQPWQVFNVGSGHHTSIRNVLTAAEQVTGRPVKVQWGPAAAEPAIMLADSTKIRSMLGWQAERSNILTIVDDAWGALTRGYSE
jgi:UDP-glucose 4-epimerase